MKKLLCVILLLLLYSCEEYTLMITPEPVVIKEDDGWITPAKPLGKVQLVEDNDIYEVINYCLSDEAGFFPSYCHNILDAEDIPWGRMNEQDSLQLVKMDTIFTTEDVAFMSRQKNLESYFKIKPYCLDKKLRVYSAAIFARFVYDRPNRGKVGDNFFSQFSRRYPHGLRELSLPLFSINHEYAYIKLSNVRATGSNSAGWILKKTPQGWKMIYKFNESFGC